MYGLPDDFKTDFLCGRTLNFVSFVKYQVYLHFSGECTISVEGEIALDKGERQGLPCSVLCLFQLIDQQIVSASSQTDGTLSLVFDNGSTLHIHDSDKRFEAYNITERGELIIRV
jgi:hypothetical protein